FTHQALLSFPTRRSSDLKDYIKKINPRHVKFALIILGGVVVLFALTATIMYNKREALLQEALVRVKKKALQEYGLHVAIEQAYLDRKSTRLNSSHVKISY